MLYEEIYQSYIEQEKEKTVLRATIFYDQNAYISINNIVL